MQQAGFPRTVCTENQCQRLHWDALGCPERFEISEREFLNHVGSIRELEEFF
jgi:hypothetical protein